MIEIQREIRGLELKLAEREKYILELEDSGSIANLTKRVKELEKELTISFDKNEAKDKSIFQLM